MSLTEKINNDLKEAKKSRDEKSLRALRAIKSALLLEGTSGKGEIDEATETRILQKLVKQRKDSIEIYQQQNRQDLATGEIEEVEVIERYLPKMMSSDELKAALQNIITTVGATSPADLGKVMGMATKALAGKAEGKAISEMVKQLLMGG